LLNLPMSSSSSASSASAAVAKPAAAASTVAKPAATDQTEAAKKKAAYAAVDAHIRTGQKIGIGSGSTIVYVVERLAERYHKEKLDIQCVSTSFQSTHLIIDAKLPLSDLLRCPELDIAIDGADEVDAQLNLIKGGGACMLQEKIVAYNAKEFVVVCDFRKDSKQLGEKFHRVPVEVVPMAYLPLMNRISKQFPESKCTLRMAVTKAGPTVTDNGNFVLDVDFGLISNPVSLNGALRAMVGVVETGLFVSMCQTAYFGQADGSVTIRKRSS